MNTYKLAWFAVPLVFASQSVVASAQDDLLTRLAAVDTLRAEFVQEVVDEDGQRMQRVQGAMYLKRPNQLYWRTDAPDESLLVADGVDVYYFNTFVEQVTITSQSDAVAQSPMLLLFNAEDEGWQGYSVREQAVETGSAYQIAPTDDNAISETLTIEFDDENVIQALQLDDGQGQVNRIVLTEQQVNQTLANDLFEFTVPQGVDVDDQRE